MIDKKKILEELYESDPSLKLKEEKTEKFVDFLLSHNPTIVAPKAFKTRLGNKLNTIGEFKQIQPKTKYNFVFFIRPLFVLVVGVFVLAQFKNYLSMKQLNMKSSPELQNIEMSLSDNTNSIIGESEIEKEIEDGGEVEPQKIVDTKPTQLSESIGNTNIASDQTSSNNETQNSEQIIIEKTLSSDSDGKSTEPIRENQIIPNQNEIIEEGDAETSLDSVLSKDVSSTSPASARDNSDSSEELSGNISPDEQYYTCENGKIIIDDSIAQRRIIKSYCDSMGGDIMNNGGNVTYYLCTLPDQEEVGIEYIAEQLCE